MAQFTLSLTQNKALLTQQELTKHWRSFFVLVKHHMTLSLVDNSDRSKMAACLGERVQVQASHWSGLGSQWRQSRSTDCFFAELKTQSSVNLVHFSQVVWWLSQHVAKCCKVSVCIYHEMRKWLIDIYRYQIIVHLNEIKNVENIMCILIY